jgi:hypothetical protein
MSTPVDRLSIVGSDRCVGRISVARVQVGDNNCVSLLYFVTCSRIVR